MSACKNLHLGAFLVLCYIQMLCDNRELVFIVVVKIKSYSLCSRHKSSTSSNNSLCKDYQLLGGLASYYNVLLLTSLAVEHIVILVPSPHTCKYFLFILSRQLCSLGTKYKFHIYYRFLGK